MTVADEKDRLAPQVEEARWRSRQLEKELTEAQVGVGVGAGSRWGCRRAPPRWRGGIASWWGSAGYACCALADCLLTACWLHMPACLQEERDRLQQAVGELEASVEQLQQREAAGEGELAQQLGVATAENAQLKEQLAAAGQAAEALQEQLGELSGERQRLEGKVQKHKQVRGVAG